MSQLRIWLFSTATLVGSLAWALVNEKPTQAKTVEQTTGNYQKQPQANLNCDRVACSGNSHLANYLKTFAQGNKAEDLPPLAEDFNVERTPEGHLILEISEEESNAAIQIFGCDCITSVNALRQMRGIAIGVEGDRILPGPTIKPCAQQRAPEIPN